MLHLRLRSEAAYYLKAGDGERAELLIEEALSLVDEGPMGNLYRALLLPTRARCRILKGDLVAAEVDLSTTWEIIEPHSNTFFAAGWQSAFSGWWSVTAKLRASRNDLLGAVEAEREVVERRRIVARLPQLEGPYKVNQLAVSLRDLGCRLRDVGDGGAQGAFEESRVLRHSIGLAPLVE